MPKKSEEPLEATRIRFFKSDLDWARERYPIFGVNRLARELLRRFRTSVERKEGATDDRERITTPESRSAEIDLDALGLLE